MDKKQILMQVYCSETHLFLFFFVKVLSKPLKYPTALSSSLLSNAFVLSISCLLFDCFLPVLFLCFGTYVQMCKCTSTGISQMISVPVYQSVACTGYQSANS